jgi:hypothetical protein
MSTCCEMVRHDVVCLQRSLPLDEDYRRAICSHGLKVDHCNTSFALKQGN